MKAYILIAIAFLLCGCGSSEPTKPVNGPSNKKPGGVSAGAYELGDPVAVGNVTVVPIMYKDAPSQKGDEMTLSEAKKLGLVEIIEIPGAEEVNRLRVHNKGDRPLLLIGGELLLGGKQDRVVVHDVIIPPGVTQDVDVDCVEHGRWEGSSKHFEYSSQIVPSRVRDAAAYQDQEKVWSNVAGYNATAGVASDGSGTIQGGLNSPEVEKRINSDLPGLIKAFEGNDRVVGVIYVLNGEIKSMDLFGNPKLFQETRQSLFHGYLAEGAIEKTASGKASTTEDFKSFLSNAVNAKEKTAEGQGVYSVGGTDFVGKEMRKDEPSSPGGGFIHGNYSKK